MFGLHNRLISMKRIWSSLIILLALSWGFVGCSDRLSASDLSTVEQPSESITTGKLAEVAPPSLIQQLQPVLNQYQPQVSIVTPKTDQVLPNTTVEVQLDVQDLPIFKNPDLEMGPHLHFIVDNEPYRAIYNIEQPVVVENLTPGTHTIRVFASRPWHESFKNEGAYAQTTFHIFTKTDNNHPDSNLPLLTYSRPNGNYGAEPIMLDFYLTNAPLHLIAQENTEDEIVDWRIRVTVNGESFLLDNWQSVYLKGFQEGQNWVQLEFIDESGKTISNVYNNTARLIYYTPKGEDTLSKLVRGELSFEQARAIIDPNYKTQSLPVTVPNPEPIPSEEFPISEEETLPQDLSSKDEEIITPEEEALPTNISPKEQESLTSPEEILPEYLSTTPENSATREESKSTSIPALPTEESQLNLEKVSSENLTPGDFSRAEESPNLSEEKTSNLEEIIPTTEEETSTSSASDLEKSSSETFSESRIQQEEPLSFEDYSEQKTPASASNSPSKYQWLEKLRNSLKRD